MQIKIYNIGVFGGGVGKTCITLRFIKKEFNEGYIITNEDDFSKIIEVDNQPVKFISLIQMCMMILQK